jgi:hypothetical protein
MNSALEFHDSEVKAIELAGGVLSIIFSSAYVHRSVGEAGTDPGQGVTQPAELVFSGAECTMLASGCSGKISDGSVLVGAKTYGLLPLPFSASGDISASFVFASGVTLNFTAQSLACSITGSPTYVESFGG